MSARVPATEGSQVPAPGAGSEPSCPARDAAWLTTGAFALILGVLVIASFATVLLGHATFVFRDYGLFSYPVAFFQRECFWQGRLPLWNPYNNCGIPFLAQWNTMALYPPALIYLLLPLPWSLPFFCLLHLFWGGLGMYRLAREWTGHRLGAALAGLVFSFNGLSFTFLMWPSHIATFGWLPWVLWLAPRAWQGGPKSDGAGAAFPLAVLAGAMQMLAGAPETILLTWIVLAVLAGADLFLQPGRRFRIGGQFLGLVVLISLICAAQLLPFLELLSHSQRDAGYSEASHSWSMPIWGWANFLVPLFRTSPTTQGVFMQNGQYWASSYYAGIGTVLLAIVALRWSRDRRVMLLGLLVFLALVLAWGDTSVLYSLLRAAFPGLGFVRYPIKFVIFVLALLPLLAAFGVQTLCAAGRVRKFEWLALLGLLLIVTCLVLLSRDASTPPDVQRAVLGNAISRGLLLMLVFGTLKILADGSRALRFMAGGTLLALFWVDSLTHVPSQNPTVPPSAYSNGATGKDRATLPSLGEGRVMATAAATTFLAQNPLPDPAQNLARNRHAARVNCNLLDHAPQVDGFFSLTPRHSDNITRLAVAEQPPPSAALLDFMGVCRITAPETFVEWAARSNAMPLVNIGAGPRFASDAETRTALGRVDTDLRTIVFLPPETRASIRAHSQPGAQVLNHHFACEAITFETDAPSASLVTIAQTWYPAWKALVDGAPVTMYRANLAFQALQVPAGRHEVKLEYADKAFKRGLWLSGIGLAAWLAVLFHPRRPLAPRERF